MKIAIIGSSGMLGKVVFNYFRMFAKDIQLIIPKKYNFDNENEFINSLSNSDFVINCSGSIPQKMPNFTSIIAKINYFKINYLLPELLLKNKFKVIHPCTDCVYKGDPNLAPYGLEASYDCDNLYGKSKACLYLRNTYNINIDLIKVIRASIIASDKTNKSLYSWTLSRIKSSHLIFGYVNHFWNGITALKWAEIALKIINNFDSFPPISVYGTNTISKYQLIKNILIVNNISPEKYLKPTKASHTVNKALILEENNFGDIFNLLIELKEFEDLINQIL
tara:strand:- start:227 stop:1063 length:837 start_codon:yes stop_codon:yes gene_type:complete